MIDQKIVLRASTVGFDPVVKTTQGDTGRRLLCSFEDFTIPGSSTAKIYVLKPSGKSVQNDATISDQTVTVELTNQILAEKGIVACQVQIINSGKAIKSFPFSLDNDRSLAGDWPESENENTFLDGVVTEMQERLNAVISQSQSATSAAISATSNAKTATSNANAAANEARQAVWNNKNLTNSTSASESQVDTAAGAAVLTGVDGKTEQVTTNGYQLFDASKLPTKSAGGATVTNNVDGSFTISGSGTLSDRFSVLYVLDHENSSKLFRPGIVHVPRKNSGDYETVPFIRVVYTYNNNDVEIYDGTEITEEMLNDNLFVIKFEFIGTSGQTIIPGTVKPMIYQDGDGTWEPYTGGAAGPNPDYQIPVQGVCGKTGDESFGFNAVIQGRNIFNPNILSGTTNGVKSLNKMGQKIVLIASSSIDCYVNEVHTKPNEEYNTTNGELIKIKKGEKKLYTKSGVFNKSYVGFYNSNKMSVTFNQFTANGIDIPDDATYMTFRIGVASPTNGNEYSGYVMISYDENVDFEPYHRSELPVTLTQPLFEGDKLMQVKAGRSYADSDGVTQTADRDLWGILRNNIIRKISSINVTKDSINELQNSKEMRVNNFGLHKNGNDIKMYSNRFRKVGNTWNNDNIGIFSTSGETLSEISFRLPLSENATWFNTHDTFVITESKFPYFEPFADQTPFLNWTTPDGGCTITTDDPLEPIISADTAQTPEGSYLLTGYINGLLGRTLDQRIEQLVALTKV